MEDESCRGPPQLGGVHPFESLSLCLLLDFMYECLTWSRRVPCRLVRPVGDTTQKERVSKYDIVSSL